MEVTLSRDKPTTFFPEHVRKLVDRVAFLWATHALAFVEAKASGEDDDQFASAVAMHELERLMGWSPEDARQYAIKRKGEDWR